MLFGPTIIRRRLMVVVAAATLASCGGGDGQGDRVEVPDQSCRLPADISPYADRQFFCIGGELLAVRLKGEEPASASPLAASLDGDYGQVAYRDPRHFETPIFADDRVMLNFRRGTESASAGDPPFYMIGIRAMPREGWAGAEERNRAWQVSPSSAYAHCLDGGSPPNLCQKDFYTDRFSIRYWWNGDDVAPEDWQALDASVRAYLAGLIVKQPLPTGRVPVHPQRPQS